jgi:hypothetical protein
VPILNILDPYEDFVVCMNVCKEGLGGVLIKKYHVVCFGYRKLKESKRNYTTRDIKLATIVHALTMWRNYLMGKKFYLRTNHYGMKHLFGQPTLNVKQTRWLKFLSEYDFETKHIKGKENKVVDALNKKSHKVHVSTIIN